MKQCLLTDFAENLLKKFQIKAWYRILGTEISSYEEFHYVKLRKYQRKMNYTRQNENSLDSLACVTMLDYDSTLVILYSKSKLEAISDSSTFCISVMTVKALHHN